MPKVTFLPINQTVDAKNGETLLEIALNHDIPLQHACGGFCSCTTCSVRIKCDSSFFSEMQEDEKDRLEGAGKSEPDIRLGCQTKILDSDVTVYMMDEDF